MTSSGLRLCVSTQTPPISFSSGYWAGRSQGLISLDGLEEGKAFSYNPGGVTRMVLPAMRRMLQSGALTSVDWISLNPSAPGTAEIDGILLWPLAIDKPALTGYGKAKEAMWGAIHGLPEQTPGNDVLWSDDFTDFTYYNRQATELIRSLDARRDFDAFMIHDFQQLPLGNMLHSIKPKIFRWHIPFDELTIPAEWRPLLSAHLESYDVIIVSSKKYLSSLRRFGYDGEVRHVYPYVDPADYSVPSGSEIESLCKHLDLAVNDKVILVVARMDPMKGQDRAIHALAKASLEDGDLKLVLVGNGSFSSSTRGIGLSKGAAWRYQLESLVTDLGLGGKVVFAGHLSRRELDAAYERCQASLLPSSKEGFGLVVLESWIHNKPPIVSKGAGIAELVHDGENGLLYEPDDIDSLAKGMLRLTSDASLARRLGKSGRPILRRCSLAAGIRAESEIIAEVV